MADSVESDRDKWWIGNADIDPLDSEPTVEKDAPRRLMHSIKDCGGCAGQGAHRRWCPYAVGETAAYFGQLSDRAESLGDSIGPNDTGAANMAWQLAALLRKRAEDARVTSPGGGRSRDD